MEQSQLPESSGSDLEEGHDHEQASEGELLEQLRKVGSDLGFRMRARKLFKILIAFVAFDLLISGVAVLALVQVRRIQVTVCQRDNTFRQSYVNQWEPLIADNPPPTPPPNDASPEVKESYDRQIRSRNAFIKGLTNDFAQHDC